jgi:hypothetical protein
MDYAYEQDVTTKEKVNQEAQLQSKTESLTHRCKDWEKVKVQSRISDAHNQRKQAHVRTNKHAGILPSAWEIHFHAHSLKFVRIFTQTRGFRMMLAYAMLGLLCLVFC